MFGYYLNLALRSLRRNPVLSLLMVVSIAIGIGATMTTLTVARVLSGDPLPGKSQHIFYPQVDAWPGEEPRANPVDMLDYTSAMDLWRAGRADRQTLVVNSEIKLQQPGAGTPAMMLEMLSVHADFFPMFEVPFAHGGSWSGQDDGNRARVAVISSDLNQRLFGGANSVGRSIRVRDSELRIVGVLEPWRPSPQYYTLAGGNFAQGDTAGFYRGPQDVFVPFETGLEVNDGHFVQFTCWDMPATPGSLRNSPCVWLQLWVELGTPARAADYRDFVRSYANQQQQQGRIQNAANARMFSLMEWLDYNHVVPRDVRLQTWIALSFLLICLFNTVGLLLAKFLRRSGEIGTRRALGASRGDIFQQCLVEAGLVGLTGGVLGWLLTLVGLWAVRAQPVEYADLARLDLPMFAATFVLAVVASLLAGVFPALRASGVAPAIQLKTL